MLKNLYIFYHKKCHYYKYAYNHYKNLNTYLNLASIVLTTTGTIVGGITLNPIILSTISGCGILLQAVLKLKNYGKLKESTIFAFTNYQKILNKIRSCLRGENFNLEELRIELRWIDDLVTDLCPVVDKYQTKYNKKFMIPEYLLSSDIATFQ